MSESDALGPKRIPVGTALCADVPRVRSEDGLLLVGHGSRCARSEQEMRTLTGMVASALPQTMVDVGFLEMTRPSAGRVLDSMVSDGCRRVTVLPIVLLGAGHSKSDVPAVVLEGRLRHPGVEIPIGRPLGVSKTPVEVLGRAVDAVGGSGLPLLVLARGTSDPDANGDAHKAARLLAEWTGSPFHYVGFSGVTHPSVTEAATVFSRLGFERFVVAWWYLSYGKLIEQGRQALLDFEAATGTSVLDAGHIGPREELVPLVMDRYREAGGSVDGTTCDLCSYRAPWPGLEDRVGQARGVGHSHLAVEHRHGGQSIRDTGAHDGAGHAAHHVRREPHEH
jgi:sirohydrochlorin cobaltochelatase